MIEKIKSYSIIIKSTESVNPKGYYFVRKQSFIYANHIFFSCFLIANYVKSGQYFFPATVVSRFIFSFGVVPGISNSLYMHTCMLCI